MVGTVLRISAPGAARSTLDLPKFANQGYSSWRSLAVTEMSESGPTT